MGMNQTPASERVHISFFGKRNAGKSSVINAVTGQDLAIVSSVMGTTTDPVYKTMELLPLGPVMVIDTPGIDDEGELGALRVRKSYQVLNKTDIAILVIDSTAGKGEEELELIHRFHKKGIPYLIVYNKIDLLSTEKIKDLAMSVRAGEVLVSASDGMNIQELKEKKIPVYFTIDLDCLDPSAFPGTGTPEAGGVSFLELLDAIRTVAQANIVGADLNELAPMLDVSGVSTATACKVLRELLLAIAK